MARFASRTEAQCRRHGLSTDQYTLLLLIEGSADGLRRSTVMDLATRLHLTQTGVTGRVQRIEDAGLVYRQRSSEDRRVYHIFLTDEGRRRLRAAFRELSHDEELIASLDAIFAIYQQEQSSDREDDTRPSSTAKTLNR